MSLGRPREFCTEKALDRALDVFWRKGYEGASLTDLTEAMQITRPSLYAAYGNKEELFRKAIDRYSEKRGAALAEALSNPSAREGILTLLMGLADCHTDPSTPSGCLMVHGALACGEEGNAIKNELMTRRNVMEEKIHQRLERARDEGELPPDSDPAGLARYFSTITQGMSVQASGGATREALHEVVLTAMQVWPVRRAA